MRLMGPVRRKWNFLFIVSASFGRLPCRRRRPSAVRLYRQNSSAINIFGTFPLRSPAARALIVPIIYPGKSNQIDFEGCLPSGRGVDLLVCDGDINNDMGGRLSEAPPT